MTTRRRIGCSRSAALGVACTIAVTACASKASVRTNDAGSSFSLLILERKPCFGTCPAYLLSIANDGSVVFEGRMHVDSMGTISSRIDMDKVTLLQKLIDENQFDALDDKYGYGTSNCGAYFADAPTVVISLTTKKGVKRVEHDLGCQAAPARLTDIARKIDDIANVSRWTTR